MTQQQTSKERDPHFSKMAFKSLCTLSHTTTLFLKLTHASPCSPILTPKSSSSIYIHHSHTDTPCLSKRKLILLSPFLWSVLPNTLLLAQELVTHDLQRYTDSNEGFTLLTPSSWTKVFSTIHYVFLKKEQVIHVVVTG